MSLDLDMLDPGIRRTVEWLREHCYDTTDSGDGKTKIAAGDRDALPYPHVAIATTADELRDTCWRLMRLLEKAGMNLRDGERDENSPQIQGTYDPADGTAIIILAGVDDAMLFGGAK